MIRRRRAAIQRFKTGTVTHRRFTFHDSRVTIKKKTKRTTNWRRSQTMSNTKQNTCVQCSSSSCGTISLTLFANKSFRVRNARNIVAGLWLWLAVSTVDTNHGHAVRYRSCGQNHAPEHTRINHDTCNVVVFRLNAFHTQCQALHKSVTYFIIRIYFRFAVLCNEKRRHFADNLSLFLRICFVWCFSYKQTDCERCN